MHQFAHFRPREHWSSDQQQIYLNPADRKAPSAETTSTTATTASSTIHSSNMMTDDNQSSTNSTSSAAGIEDESTLTTTSALTTTPATSFTIDNSNNLISRIDDQRVHNWLLQTNGQCTTPISMRVDKWNTIGADRTSKNGGISGSCSVGGNRVEKTRIDAEQFIDSMLKETIGEYELRSSDADTSDEGMCVCDI